MRARKTAIYDPILLTLPETAGLLGVGRSTIYGLIREGKLPTVKIGKCSRIERAAVEQFIKTHARGEVQR